MYDLVWFFLSLNFPSYKSYLTISTWVRFFLFLCSFITYYYSHESRFSGWYLSKSTLHVLLSSHVHICWNICEDYQLRISINFIYPGLFFCTFFSILDNHFFLFLIIIFFYSWLSFFSILDYHFFSHMKD